MGIPVALHGFGGGGGASLNFKVVGGLTQPADPSENTILVHTDVDITSYVFSPTDPADPEQGMVWFRTGTSSPCPFNALKKNGIVICPLSASQYVDGAWQDVAVKIYQDDTWLDLLTDIVFYADGEFNAAVFGTISGNYADHDTFITITSGQSLTAGKSININAYDRIEIVVGASDYCGMNVKLTPDDSSEAVFTASKSSASGNLTWTIDLSSVTRSSPCRLSIYGDGEGQYVTPYFTFTSVKFLLAD